MNKTTQKFKKAFEELPEETQEGFGIAFLEQIEEWTSLRAEVEKGLDAIKGGDVVPFENAATFLARMHRKHGAS